MNTKLLIGIYWKILSCICFAGVNIIVKYLAGSKFPIAQPLPILSIILFQNIISTILLMPFIFNMADPIKCFFNTKKLNLQLSRAILTIFGILLWYHSLISMPIAQAIAISFISPILTLIGAVIFLQEQLNFKKLIAIILSLIGGILIGQQDLLDLFSKKPVLNPTNQINFYTLNNYHIFLPILAGLIFSLDKLITRKILIYNECTKLTTLYILFLTIPLCLILIFINNSWVLPNNSNLLALLLLGILGAMANFAFTKSLATAEVTSIMPYGITKLIVSSILSYIIFDEVLKTFNVWLGVIIISISTILLL